MNILKKQKSKKNKAIHFFVWLCFLLFVGQALFNATHAQDASSFKEITAKVDKTRTTLKDIQTTLQDAKNNLNEQELLELRNRLKTIQSEATTIEESLAPSLESVQARLAELGHLDPALPETSDLKKQRELLKKEATDIDGQLKTIRLVTVETKQVLEDLDARRRAQYQAVISQRGLSIFSSTTWIQIAEQLPHDWSATKSTFDHLNANVVRIPLSAKLLLLGLAILWVLGLLYAWKIFILFLLNRSQSTRLRRTLLATMLVALYVAIPTGLILLFNSLLIRADDLNERFQLFTGQLVGIVALGGFIAGLGRALLAPNKPTWRLPSIPDSVATSLQWLPLVLGGFIAVLWTLQRLADVINSSISTALLINGVFALGLNAIVGIALVRTKRHYRTEGKLELATPLATSIHNLALTIIFVAVLASLASLLLGYTAFSNLIIQEVVWLALIIFTAYLFYCFFGDVATAAINNFEQENQERNISDKQARIRSQIVLLFTGILKVLLLLTALTLIFLPFGEDPMVWLNRRISFLMEGFTLGEVILKPTAFLYAALVLVLGTWIVQTLQNWLANKYLPLTGLDEGMSSSTARLISYLGYVIAGMMALSAAGIGFDRMAWILSALSVGIGFGLQAVVQNFVSGLLLLAERPIKVGDWVTLGTEIEGNVRRINARATEIEMFDKSTMIVPNSEFITKTVRNVTLSNPMGRARITVILPVNVNAELVKNCLFDAVETTKDVLEDPEPFILIDGFEAGGIAFSLYFYLSTPRLIFATRSEVFFKVLSNFEKEQLTLHPTQRMEVIGSEKTSGTTSSVANISSDIDPKESS